MHKYAYRLTKLRKFHDGNKNQQILKQKSGLAGSRTLVQTRNK